MQKKFFNTETLVDVGTKMLQLIAQKYNSMETNNLPVVPTQKPGFIKAQLPTHPPLKGEPLEQILKDTEDIIFPGQTLWGHPYFFAYYPSNVSHAAVFAEMYATAFNTPGFQWIANPVQTELENVVCDWVVQAMDLPQKFLMKNEGGGTISTTVSDSIFITVHAAKQRKMKELGIDIQDPRTLKFVAYYSANVHSSSQKALFLKDIFHQRAVPAYLDEKLKNYKVDLNKFQEMVKEDLQNGLVPFWYGSSWGTTATCAYDQIQEIGEICSANKIWLNVDAAYAGLSWLIPGYRQNVSGLDLADSIQVNFAKMGLCGLIGTLTYIADKLVFAQCMGNYSKHGGVFKNKFTDEKPENEFLDYMDLQVHLGRRFNALKLWWVIRSYGIEGLRENVLSKTRLAQYFEKLVLGSECFKTYTKQELGLATFLIHDDNLDRQNEMNERLNIMINSDTTKGFVSSLALDGVYFLRISIANETTTEKHIDCFWEHINNLAAQIKQEMKQ